MQELTKERSRSIVIFLSFLLCIPIFLFDTTTPQGSPDPVLYIVPMMIVAYRARRERPLVLIGLLAMALTIIGFYISPAGVGGYTLLDFAFTVFALIASTVLGYYIIGQTVKLGRLNDGLRENNERLERAGRELEELNKKMEENIKALNRSNEDLQDFAYVVSHDLKSPLSTISSFLQLLRLKYEGKVLDQKADEYIDYAMRSSAHMARLIDDLLQYSRIDQGDLERMPVDMNTVFDRVRENLNATIDELGAAVSSDPLPTVNANGSQMVQLLQNLVANALKFHGQEAPVVHLSATRADSMWQFSVKDNGIGVDPRYKDKLFKLFSRLHSQEEYEGTGIGLATVKRIVERNGGKVWLDSEVGKGTTFFFTIPDDVDRLADAAHAN